LVVPPQQDLLLCALTSKALTLSSHLGAACCVLRFGSRETAAKPITYYKPPEQKLDPYDLKST
jgi:hypothetical protein